jgi:hypothetical protein
MPALLVDMTFTPYVPKTRGLTWHCYSQPPDAPRRCISGDHTDSVVHIGQFGGLIVETVSRHGVFRAPSLCTLSFGVTATTVVDECGNWPTHWTKTSDGYLRCQIWLIFLRAGMQIRSCDDDG